MESDTEPCKRQAEECLKKEKDRVSHYLHSNSEQKLVEVIFHLRIMVRMWILLMKFGSLDGVIKCGSFLENVDALIKFDHI